MCIIPENHPAPQKIYGSFVIETKKIKLEVNTDIAIKV